MKKNKGFFLKTYDIKNSTVLNIYSEISEMNFNPAYQREGGVWTLEKKQLLIDSIINEYDIPKLYVHGIYGKRYRYSVVDGKQRLNAIFDFIKGKFPLGDDFDYLKDPNVKASGLYYTELGEKYPSLKWKFDGYTLPIVCIETDDIDLIEDMFSRLNEAVPLNSAEKRNAIGGPMATCVKEVAKHKFFTKKVSVSNKRYRHYEIAVKFLYLESKDEIADTKKVYLDNLVRKYKKEKGKNAEIKKLRTSVFKVLDKLCKVFNDNDKLLNSQAILTVYYMAMYDAIVSNNTGKFTREKLVSFNKKRANNKKIAEDNLSKANYDLLEFDRLNIQGTNDSNSISERVRILNEFLGIQY